jgi:hypothetical protein
VRIGLAAAGGRNLEVFSPTIGRRLLELGLIDEIDLHVAPILLGEGIGCTTTPQRADPRPLGRRGPGQERRPHVGRERAVPDPSQPVKIPTEGVGQLR